MKPAFALKALFMTWALASVPAEAETIALPQSDGGELVLEAPALRIITLAPHLAELVYAAGAGDLLLGTVEYSDYPDAAVELPRIGDAFRFDMERILALKPDLILVWQSGNPLAAQERLSELGLTTWRIEIRAPEDIAATLEQIGTATGRMDTAQRAASDLRSSLATLQTRFAGRDPISYFFQIAAQPLYTVNGAHLISQGLAICGAKNIFADLPQLAPQVSHESVVLADPEALIAPRLDVSDEPLAQWSDWPRMRAVASGAAIYLPVDHISRATPRMLDGIELACNLLDDLRDARP